MSVAGSQQRTLLQLLAQLQPHWHRDRNLPARIHLLLARNRAFGSRDRRLYRELIYTTLRFLPWIEPDLSDNPESAVKTIAWLAADLPATVRFRAALVADWPACPADVAQKAEVLRNSRTRPKDAASAGATRDFNPEILLPAWFRAHCPGAFSPAELNVLHARAPLWLRLQAPDVAPIAEEFAQLGWKWEIADALPSAIKLLDEVDVTKTKAFENGLIEVQDLGSQLLLESVGITPGQRWLDACAGAGGKTLQLARLLGAAGHVDAADIRPAALQELSLRAKRARSSNITVLSAAPSGTYDGVLVDAPCSGSGTWRRAPHLKWTTSEPDIIDAARLQSSLLAQFSERVAPGGRLIYATCSLSQRENEDVVRPFLLQHPTFESELIPAPHGAESRGGGLTFLPSLHNTDGFFVAAFRRVR